MGGTGHRVSKRKPGIDNTSRGTRRYIESLSGDLRRPRTRTERSPRWIGGGLAPEVASEQAIQCLDRSLWAGTGKSTTNGGCSGPDREVRLQAVRGPVRRDTPRVGMWRQVARRLGRYRYFTLPPVARLGTPDPGWKTSAPFGSTRVADGRPAPPRTCLPIRLNARRKRLGWRPPDRRTGRPDASNERLTSLSGGGKDRAVVIRAAVRFTSSPPAAAATPRGFRQPALSPSTTSRPDTPATDSARLDTTLVSDRLRPGEPGGGEIDPGTIRDTGPAAGSCRGWPLDRCGNRNRWSKMRRHRRELLYGKKGRYLGISTFLRGLRRAFPSRYIRVFLRIPAGPTCNECGGSRLQPRRAIGSDRR